MPRVEAAEPSMFVEEATVAAVLFEQATLGTYNIYIYIHIRTGVGGSSIISCLILCLMLGILKILHPKDLAPSFRKV